MLKKIRDMERRRQAVETARLKLEMEEASFAAQSVANFGGDLGPVQESQHEGEIVDESSAPGHRRQRRPKKPLVFYSRPLLTHSALQHHQSDSMQDTFLGSNPSKGAVHAEASVASPRPDTVASEAFMREDLAGRRPSTVPTRPGTRQGRSQREPPTLHDIVMTSSTHLLRRDMGTIERFSLMNLPVDDRPSFLPQARSCPTAAASCIALAAVKAMAGLDP